jgi:1-deoxy-D-xylulose-5-phosphate reductoisomerase
MEIYRQRGPGPGPGFPLAAGDPAISPTFAAQKGNVMKRIVILGSTGSIGTQTLEIIDQNMDQFTVEGLTAHSNWKLLAEQARRFCPRKVAIADPEQAGPLREAIDDDEIEILSGNEGVRKVAVMDADMVVVAVVGKAGLVPTIAAVEKGRTIALANKETLVVGGELITRMARENGVAILPIDSEHSAILQCLNGEDRKNVRKIHLTSSGGPFRELPREEIDSKTAGDALIHPTWKNMGKKVTIDSSTLMNKGFEVIEARWLFDIDPDRIQVLIHPQSIIHSMVEFTDGSVMAQMSRPDMRIPIQYALTYPRRLPASFVENDFVAMGGLTFEAPRRDVFPCLDFAYHAIKMGGTLPAVLNAANEVAVEMFLAGSIRFGDIQKVILRVMEMHRVVMEPALKDLLEADSYARQLTYNLCRGGSL